MARLSSNSPPSLDLQDGFGSTVGSWVAFECAVGHEAHDRSAACREDRSAQLQSTGEAPLKMAGRALLSVPFHLHYLPKQTKRGFSYFIYITLTFALEFVNQMPPKLLCLGFFLPPFLFVWITLSLCWILSLFTSAMQKRLEMPTKTNSI